MVSQTSKIFNFLIFCFASYFYPFPVCIARAIARFRASPSFKLLVRQFKQIQILIPPRRNQILILPIFYLPHSTLNEEHQVQPKTEPFIDKAKLSTHRAASFTSPDNINQPGPSPWHQCHPPPSLTTPPSSLTLTYFNSDAATHRLNVTRPHTAAASADCSKADNQPRKTAPP